MLKTMDHAREKILYSFFINEGDIESSRCGFTFINPKYMT